MRKAIAYSRVSTGRQVAGSSLDDQFAKIKLYCQSKGWEVPQDIHSDEGVSGRSTKNRPGLEAALEAVCEHQGVLVVATLSRLARSTRDACEILARIQGCGADLAILDLEIDTSAASGKLIFSIIAAISEFESALISERVKSAQQHLLKKRGFHAHGRPPVGFKHVDGERIPVQEELDWLEQVKTIAKNAPDGNTAANRLRRWGVPTLTQLRTGKGAPWTASKLWQLLNPKKRGAQHQQSDSEVDG